MTENRVAPVLPARSTRRPGRLGTATRGSPEIVITTDDIAFQTSVLRSKTDADDVGSTTGYVGYHPLA